MAERENKKSLKDRAQEALQGVIEGVAEALESLLPSQSPRLVPVRANNTGRRPMPRPRRRR